MKFKSVLSLVLLVICAASTSAQTELVIKKKTSIKIPGMEGLMQQMPKKPSNPLTDRSSTINIKGARMRTDIQAQVPKMGGMKNITFSSIIQCDKQRYITFDSDKKTYHLESTNGPSAQTVQNLKKSGSVTITGSVTDTGERATLFGYEAKHLKQIFTITPSKNSCMKESLQVETEGWYADLPEFSCPMKRQVQEFQPGNDCYDEVIDEVKGVITGFALKEIKKITSQGQTVIVEEETTSLTKTTIADSLFEPPAGYTAANALKEAQGNSADIPNTENNTIQNPSSVTFPLPTAGIQTAPIGEKKIGMRRIGIVKPKVTTPDSKNDPSAGDEISLAVRNSLIESLKAENVETVSLETDFPENECQEKQCDYIFYTNVTQKRGGGMFKSMVLMGAATMAGAMVPGVGGIIATAAASQVMGQTMGKMAKAKDEFTLDYKVSGLDKTILSQAVIKKKAEKEGEDVLTPQIIQASNTVLAEITKKQTK